MSPTVPALSRRGVLAGGAALAVLGLTASACGSPPQQPPAVDELEAQLQLARRDGEQATAAAAVESPPVGPALKEVAAERNLHAQALAAEIDRVAGITTTTSTETTTTTTTTAPPGPPPTLSDVVNSLRASAASASQLAATSSGYRAGLLGSITASCTAAYTVGLVFTESAP
ncbi:hypothetical protein [Mycobacterium sp.]|uniref:hypothetical protein n=1 Tax=Mycobacterium sp. TaxID=1785 RepID=UPI003D6B9EB6